MQCDLLPVLDDVNEWKEGHRMANHSIAVIAFNERTTQLALWISGNAILKMHLRICSSGQCDDSCIFTLSRFTMARRSLVEMDCWCKVW